MALNIFSLLDGLPEFDGKPEELDMFLKHVEEIRKHIDVAFISLFDLRVRNKIISKANVTLINNNNPTNWDEIKVILRINFNISDSLESIINNIKAAEFRTSVSDFYEYMLKLLTKLNLKTSIDKDNEQWYSCKKNECMVLKIFISKLPNEPKLILNSRNPYSLLKAKEILIETDNFYGKDLYKHNMENKFYNKKFHQYSNQNLKSSQSSFNRFQQQYKFGNKFDNEKMSNQNDNFNFSNQRTPNNFENFPTSFQSNRYPHFQGNRFGSENVQNRGSFLNLNNNNSNTKSQNSINNSNRMDVDNIQVSNFQPPAEKLYPV